jgi:hypothetical protein
VEEIKRAAQQLKKAIRTGKTTNVRVGGRTNIRIVRNVGGAGSTTTARATQHAPIVQDG